MSLIDHDIRQRAISEVESSFALAAGAGAGKTSVLVQRLTSHLLAGTPPGQVAAITFTRAAANELAARSRDAIEERLADAQRRGDARAQRTLEEILNNFGDLTLSTIHSFCQELLKREALEAQWAPDTQVDDVLGGATRRAVERAWRRGFEERHPRWGVLLRRWVKDSAPFNNSLTLKSTLGALDENRDLTPLLADPEEIDFAAARSELMGLRDCLADLMGRCRNPATCKLYACCVDLLGALDALLSIGDPEACVMAALDSELPKLKFGTKKDWDPADKDAVLGCGQELQGWQGGWKARIGAQLHRALLLDLQAHYLDVLAQARVEQAQADFSELLFRSKELLLNNPGARRRLAARYQVLLIDEVQDTDPIQAEVAALLTRPHEETGLWHASSPRPGSLFAVGDPKQSIYRFRRADVQVWRQLQDLIARRGEAMALRQNFRSVPGIVSWVNHTFAGLPDFEPQVAWRHEASLDPVVLIDVQQEEGDDEIEALTRHLVHLKATSAQVFDKALGGLRPVEDRDFLILLPSWTNAPAIQESLVRAGIECTVEGGYSFFERDEVRLLMAAMRAIDEPQDGEAVVGALRGLFGLSFEALADHRAREGSWSSLSPAQPVGPVGEALKVLGRLHGLRHERSWVELLDELLEHTGAPAVWAMTIRRWSMLANLDKLKTLIRQVEPRTRSSSEVIEALEEMSQNRSEDLSLVDEDNQAARVMTYFKAKGLEAPVVAIVCASTSAPTPTRVVVRSPEGDALAVAPDQHVAPPQWPELAREEREAFEEERRRWMYVAATRARDQLAMIRSDNKKKSLLLKTDDLRGGLPQDVADAALHGQWTELASGVEVRRMAAHLLPEAPSHQATFLGGLDPEVDALLQAPIGHRGDPEGETRARQIKTALAASRRASSRWRAVGNLVGGQEHLGETGGVGPEGGKVVHSVMEHLDLGQPEETLRDRVPGLVTAFAAMAGLPDGLTARCQEVVERLLSHEVIAQARRAPERWREVPFAYHDAGTVITGRIDLCFPTDASRTTWKVVDWKSHLPAPGTAEHDTYQRQLGHYARAVLATVTPCRHVETVLAAPHEEIGVADPLPELLELVREELVELVAELNGLGLCPVIGHEPETEPYVELELAWPARKLGLGLDLSQAERDGLARAGWRVAVAETWGTTWADEAAEAIYELLGITPGAEGSDE